MKHYLKFNRSIICSFMMFLSCTSVSNKKIFQGNWWGCFKDGTYLEMYMSDSSFKFCFEDIGVSFETNIYKINRDTLVYQNGDNTRPVKLTFTFPNQDLMIWNYFELNEKWEFHRMSEKIREYPLNKFDSTTFALLELIKKDVKIRASKYKCIDRRTDKEKYQDSLDKRNVFKF